MSLKHRICVAAVAAGAVLASATVLAPVATADTPGCVTKAEFRAVRNGWSMTRVRNRFDTNGKQVWFFSATRYTPAEQGREYRACRHPSFSTVEVDYKKHSGIWRVESKFAFWG